jgi:Putative prokaryotic signal transducing protein
MSAPKHLVTVYRSMDATAKEDCETLIEILKGRGIAAEMQDDSAPDVPEGAYQVVVPEVDAAQADKLIAENQLPDEVEKVDNSEHLNLETISHAQELEAMGIKNLLEANGIATVLVGDSVLPNFPFEVRVARDMAKRAREIIAEAESAEPAGEPSQD